MSGTYNSTDLCRWGRWIFPGDTKLQMNQKCWPRPAAQELNFFFAVLLNFAAHLKKILELRPQPHRTVFNWFRVILRHGYLKNLLNNFTGLSELRTHILGYGTNLVWNHFILKSWLCRTVAKYIRTLFFLFNLSHIYYIPDVERRILAYPWELQMEDKTPL
jgi:hypothetical protein